MILSPEFQTLQCSHEKQSRTTWMPRACAVLSPRLSLHRAFWHHTSASWRQLLSIDSGCAPHLPLLRDGFSTFRIPKARRLQFSNWLVSSSLPSVYNATSMYLFLQVSTWSTLCWLAADWLLTSLCLIDNDWCNWSLQVVICFAGSTLQQVEIWGITASEWPMNLTRTSHATSQYKNATSSTDNTTVL